MAKNIFFIAIVMCIPFSLFAFSGSGAGTEKKTYLITTADELFEVRSELNAYYKLMNDIDLQPWLEENSPKFGWNPIGTLSAPFNGHFDGNCKAIKNIWIDRPETNNVGLFGYIESATLTNIIILNPHITGNSYVGGILGQRNVNSSYDQLGPGELSISKCYVVGGEISGVTYVGGILGYNCGRGNVGSLNIECCHNSANIKADSYCGGICGSMVGYASSNVSIRNCFSTANVTGMSYIGGILGQSEVGYSWISKYDCGRPNLICEKNYVCGNVIGSIDANCNGIAGACIAHNWTPGSWGSPTVTGSYIVSSNVCIADTIMGSYRITSDVTSNDNYSSANTLVLLANGVPNEVEDNPQNGASLSTRLLQKASTYESIGWDFNSTWHDGSAYNTFPCHKDQSIIPTVEYFEAKSKGVISGTAVASNGMVYAIIKGYLYSSPVIDGKWEIDLGFIEDKEMAVVFFWETNKFPSSVIKSYAKLVHIEPIVTLGDANGDSSVDTADVVAIVNHILGKSSVSFVENNADLNGDGQVSVDDAVATVQLILDKE